jgi:hypothetical protein
VPEAAALERIAVRAVRQLLHPYEAYPEALSSPVRVLPPCPRPVLLDADLEDVVAQVRDAAAGFIAAEATARGSVLHAVEWCAACPVSLSRAFREFARVEAQKGLSNDQPLSAQLSAPPSSPGRSGDPAGPAHRDFLALVPRRAPRKEEEEETERMVRRAVALLQSRASWLEAQAQDAGEMERTGLLRELAVVRQDVERMGAEWRRWRDHSLVEGAMGCGLQTCRVLLAAERVPVLTLRQDLDLCRRHLLVSLAEASAVEVDVVGRTGGRLGAGVTEADARGRIIQDMPTADARKYAAQARELHSDVLQPQEADTAVGAAHLRQSYTQLGGALRGTCEAASKASAERATRERDAILAHIRIVVPTLQERRAVAEGLEEKRTRLAAELERMRGAVASIKEAEGRKVVALAELVARAEKRNHVRGDAAVDQLARELDGSAPARAERLQEQLRQAELEAVAETSKLGGDALARAEREAVEAVAAAEREAREAVEALRSGQWMGVNKSPTERRLEAVTASTTERRKEADGLREALALAEQGVAAAMRKARHEQRLADARRDTKRMFALRRTPPAVMARFFTGALQAGAYSPALVRAMRLAHEKLLTRAEEHSQEQRRKEQATRQPVSSGVSSGATESAVRQVLDAAARRTTEARAGAPDRLSAGGSARQAPARRHPASDEPGNILNRLHSILKSTARPPASGKGAAEPSVHQRRINSASSPVDLPSARSIRGLDGQVRERARQWLRQDDSPLAAGMESSLAAMPAAADSKADAASDLAAVPASRLSRQAARQRTTPPRARIAYDSPTGSEDRRFSIGVSSAKTARELLEAAASSPGSEQDDRVEAALVDLMRRRDSPQQAEADEAIASIVGRLKQSLGSL